MPYFSASQIRSFPKRRVMNSVQTEWTYWWKPRRIWKVNHFSRIFIRYPFYILISFLHWFVKQYIKLQIYPAYGAVSSKMLLCEYLQAVVAWELRKHTYT